MQMEELYSTEGDYGLRTLSEPDEAVVDIVFVHGLTGNRETTWTQKQSKTFWPQTLLARDLPNARILTFGYDADIVGALNTAGSNTLRDHGKSLANDVALRRMRSSTNQRPLIFVAHSLGGLVVEQALLVARGAAQQHLKDVLESTVAIAFMGTPHVGSTKADWATPLTRLSNVLRKTNSEIVQVLKPGSEMLANLQQEFHTMLDDRSKNHKKTMEIFCFYEERPVVGIGEIVPKHSAILSAYPNRSIHANHMQMTKFSGAKDAGYVAISDQLWLWVDALQKEAEAQTRSASASQVSAEEVRERRNRRFGTMQDVVSGSQYFGSVNSGGGPVFQGNQSAGRDFNVGMGSR